MKKIMILLLFGFTSLFAFEHLTVDDFDEKIKNKKVIIDFYASWCPPCKVVEKTLKKYSETKPEDVQIYKVDITTEKKLMERFNIQSIPVLLYVNNGIPKSQEVGVKYLNEIKSNVDKYLR